MLRRPQVNRPTASPHQRSECPTQRSAALWQELIFLTTVICSSLRQLLLMTRYGNKMLLILTDTIFTPPNSKPQWFEVDRAATHNRWEAVELSTAAFGEDSLRQDEPRLM